MPKYAARNLPTVQRMAKRMVSHFERQFVHIRPGEVVANVVCVGLLYDELCRKLLPHNVPLCLALLMLFTLCGVSIRLERSNT